MAVKIYEIPKEELGKVKSLLEAPEKEEANAFARQGYKLISAKSLGIETESNYLYIDASDEFFEKNEPTLVENGAKLIKDEEAETIKARIEAQSKEAEAGLGAIFG